MERSLAVPVICAALAACGGPGSRATPVSPTPTSSNATATATAITITGPTAILTGETALFDATAAMSNGNTIYHLGDTWSTDNANVATIARRGILTAHGPGDVTVAVMYRGAAATTTVHVSPQTTNAFPGSANLTIAFRPDPVTASRVPCGSPTALPTWDFEAVYKETHGVGFTVKLEMVNLYTDAGLYDTEIYQYDYYFAPGSEFKEEDCTNLGGAPSGFMEDIVQGVDDNGNRLSFRTRVRLLPLAGTNSR